MASSVMNGVGAAVVGVWRAHTVLDESDGAESPEAPDRFRKLRSSSSLNSLRMSLRKRLPLREVQTSSLPENPTWETLQQQTKPSMGRKLARSARSSIGCVYQRLQRSKESGREECLVATPGRLCDGEEESGVSSRTPKCTPRRPTIAAASPRRRTPRSAVTPRRTPKKGTPEAAVGVRGVKTGGGRRHLVRMAALRSPFASPNTESRRQTFDRELESVSSGLRRLKRLSRAFDDIIGRDDRTGAQEHHGGGVMLMRRLDPSGELSRSSLTRRATHLSNTLVGWTRTAADIIRKPN